MEKWLAWAALVPLSAILGARDSQRLPLLCYRRACVVYIRPFKTGFSVRTDFEAPRHMWRKTRSSLVFLNKGMFTDVMDEKWIRSSCI